MSAARVSAKTGVSPHALRTKTRRGYNAYRAGNWGYAASMPMIFGIGLSPLLQWLILPPAMMGAYRKLGPVLFGHRTEA